MTYNVFVIVESGAKQYNPNTICYIDNKDSTAL